MALSTYSDLLSAIGRWLSRDDSSEYAGDLITLAEEAISADLVECPVMHQRPAAIALASAATSFSLPADAFKLLSARLVELDRDMPIVPMQSITRGGTIDETAPPRVCAVSGASDAGVLTVNVWPYADTDYTVDVLYAAAVPALDASDQTTNFILTRAPSLYLYGALLAAAPLLDEDPRVATWQRLYDAALARFRAIDWGGEALLRTDVPVTSGSGFNINTGE